MSVNHYTTEMRLLVHNDSTGDYVVVKEDPDGLGMVGLSYGISYVDGEGSKAERFPFMDIEMAEIVARNILQVCAFIKNRELKDV